MIVTICGLSGQGIIVFSETLTDALLRSDIEVIATDYPAAAHRDSGFHTDIKIDEGDRSPRILPGESDLIIGFERFYTLRTAMKYANKGANVVFNTYAKDVRDADRDSGVPGTDFVEFLDREETVDYFTRGGIERENLYQIDASLVSQKVMGTQIATNTVMLGAVAGLGFLPVSRDDLREAMVANLSNLPEQVVEDNIRAFNKGIESVDTVDGAKPSSG